jgi:CDP-diacylglycerol--serine O-phosphatidyltransferase
VLFSLSLVYMFSGIWARAAYSWSRRRRKLPDGTFAPPVEPAAPEPEPLNRS